jgi:hypothetical protein
MGRSLLLINQGSVVCDLPGAIDVQLFNKFVIVVISERS